MPHAHAKSLLASAALLLVSSSAHAEVVVNEFLRNTSGAPGEFVELYNNAAAGEAPIDIGGWKVKAGTSGLTVRATIPAGTLLAPGGYWLVSKVGPDAGAPAGDAGVNGQTDLSGNLPGATGASSDCIQLTDAADLAKDTVVYGGTSNSDGFLDDTGVIAVSLAAEPSAGRSLYRNPNGTDTNQSGADFAKAASAAENTPGAANYVAPPVPDAGPSSSSSSSSGNTSSSGGRSSSSSSGGRSSSSGGRSDAGGSGGMNPEGDDDDDNSNLAADDGGCSMGASGAPMPFLIGLGALLVIRRRRLARK